MAKYVLIGGGEVGRGKTHYETKKIDESIVKLANKPNPNFLFVGLASSFSDSYYDTMKKIYTDLGCNCQYLKKKNILNNPDIVSKKITSADIIYFCGGDSIKLINDLKKYELVSLLKEKAKTDCILVGASAGAIMLCKSGLSDSRMLREETDDYELISGLNFVNVSICPHYNIRKKELKRILAIDLKKVYGLENNTALIINGKDINYIKSSNLTNIYLCYYENEKYVEKKLF